MQENKSFHFTSSTVKIPQFFPINHHHHHHHRHNHRHHRPLFADLNLSLSSVINNSKHSFTHFISSLNTHPILTKLHFNNNNNINDNNNNNKPKLFNIFRSTKLPLLCSASLALTKADEEGTELTQSSKSYSVSRNSDDERVLISEVLVRNKDGDELERKDLEEEAIAALKRCRPNSALTLREVQEDVHRIIGSGYFSSCMPVAVDTRDGIRLVFQVEPNQDFQGLICEGANVLPTKFVEDKFRDGYGKIVNIRRLDEVINSINGWYMERGLFGLVSGVEILSGGILRLQVSEAEVNNISIRFLNKTGEPTTGKTRPETILRQLNTKKGQVYSMLQAKRDVDTLLAMGIMEDVSIVPQPAGDSGKVDLTINAVERVSGGISAGGGISSGITSGPLAGLIGRTPGTLVHGPHGNQPNNSSPTITRITSAIEYSRPFRPKWSGTAGLTFQRAGARDDKGNPMIRDFHNCPLTASGNNHDDMVLAKVESVYTGSSDPSSSMFVVTMEQGLPVWSEWLVFNRVTVRARKGLVFGPARLNLSLSGGHVVGNFPPHEAFPIGGTNSVRGYEEGDIGSGRSYGVGCGEISFPLVGPVEGVMFADYGTDLGSGPTVPGDPAGPRSKPGSGYGYGVGVRVASPLGPLRLEYAFSDKGKGRFHFGVGQRN
ncbi:hypothetical protein M8C21_002068 [Ambrosia artemisiifolia]|uniref:POTRA domain-containing protein n=1 Tax=Ambrosia artemisiifolia TaxID=4212 RepID=A0AAD5BWC1_AMBAR|nr:hypothetical protein M8C21_002068 [Ambrosia artemisiifolia]